jgi:hypothetical protein
MCYKQYKCFRSIDQHSPAQNRVSTHKITQVRQKVPPKPQSLIAKLLTETKPQVPNTLAYSVVGTKSVFNFQLQTSNSVLRPVSPLAAAAR